MKRKHILAVVMVFLLFLEHGIPETASVYAMEDSGGESWENEKTEEGERKENPGKEEETETDDKKEDGEENKEEEAEEGNETDEK